MEELSMEFEPLTNTVYWNSKVNYTIQQNQGLESHNRIRTRKFSGFRDLVFLL